MSLRQLTGTSPQIAPRANETPSPTHHNRSSSSRSYNPLAVSGKMASGGAPKYRLGDFYHRGLGRPPHNTRYKSETVERVSQLDSFNSQLPQVKVTAPPMPLTVARRAIISRYENLLLSRVALGSVLSVDPDLQKIFDVDSDPQGSNLVSSRLIGLEVPRILGVAPFLIDYHILWRLRYTLEIQLNHVCWGDFQKRFGWARIEHSYIRTPSLDVEIDVIEELIYILKLTEVALSKVYRVRPVPSDYRNTRDFVKAELISLGKDIPIYEKALINCRQELVKDKGKCHRKSFQPESWERDAFVQESRPFNGFWGNRDC